MLQSRRVGAHDQHHLRRLPFADGAVDGYLAAVFVQGRVPVDVNDHADGGVFLQIAADDRRRPFVGVVIARHVVEGRVVEGRDAVVVEPPGQSLSHPHHVVIRVRRPVGSGGGVVVPVGRGVCLGGVGVDDEDHGLVRQGKVQGLRQQGLRIEVRPGHVAHGHQLRVLRRQQSAVVRRRIEKRRIVLRRLRCLG